MSRLYIEYGLGWSWTQSRVRMEMRSKRSNVVVAVESGRIIGFAIMAYSEGEARLNLFAVDPENRRTGVGTRLIHWLEKTALVNGSGVVYLEARAGNIGAIQFYESLGYRVVHKLPRYYGGRETAVRMVHDLWSAVNP